MEIKILISLALIVCAVGLTNGIEYPAGVDPRSCPNYPNCDNAVLHGAETARVSHGNSWNSVPAILRDDGSWDSWRTASQNWNLEAVPTAVSSAAQYPAGVNPRSCPNYPNCDNVALHRGAFNPHANPNSWDSNPSPVWNAASNGHPAPAPVAPQYPAGVSAQSCPNYPYCSINK